MKNSKTLILLILILIFSDYTVGFSAELPAPTIAVNPDIYYPLEEVLYLEGRTIPNATIQIQFQKSGAKPINLTSKSDGNGEWVLAEKVPLEEGNWEARARILQSSGSSSPWSNPRLIKTIVSGVTIGGVTLKFTLLAFFMAIILTLGGIVVFYLFLRIKFFKSRAELLHLAKERQEVETLVEHNFADLKRSVSQELNHLEEKLKVNGVLNKEEEEHRENLMRELRHAEEEIEKKLKDLG